MIIFTSTKIFSDKLAERLTSRGFHADRLHGDLSQAAREKVLKKLKAGQIQILVATDVAARGLHIDDVELIINYDRAEDDDTHLHRVGRTGRMGAKGKAVTFIERKETLKERYSDNHPDFAWMKGGVDMDSLRRPPYRRGGSDRREEGRGRPGGRRPTGRSGGRSSHHSSHHRPGDRKRRRPKKD